MKRVVLLRIFAKTVAGRLGRELKRKLRAESLVKEPKKLEIYERVLKQKKDDKSKIYSLHELEVGCITKGKEHKKYEFGSTLLKFVKFKRGF